jgi:hypothetical protein
MAGPRLCESTRHRLHLDLYKICNMQNALAVWASSHDEGPINEKSGGIDEPHNSRYLNPVFRTIDPQYPPLTWVTSRRESGRRRGIYRSLGDRCVERHRGRHGTGW